MTSIRIVAALLSSLFFLSCSLFRPSARQPQPAGPVHIWPSWEDSVLSTLSLEEKVGQMFMVGMHGHYVSEESDEHDRIKRQVTEIGVGGVILWQGDVFESAMQLNALQRVARVPLLVGADLERGLSMRVRRGTAIPDAMAIGATRCSLYAYQAGRIIALEARSLGIHQNYAPVADINTNALNPVINTRAFGDDPKLVAAMVREFIRGTIEGGVLPTLKHFPGHGDTGVDSHIDLPVLPFTRARLDSIELFPFREGLKQDDPAVMVGHIGVPAWEPARGYPATLSEPVVSVLLRDSMGFRGLIVTDAMEMHAVTRGHTPGQAAVLAVRAGCDLVLMSPDVAAAHAAVVRAVHTGELDEQRINGSVRRILAAKRRTGLADTRYVDTGLIARTVGTRSHRMMAREIARKAITLLRNDGGILPLGAHQRLASIVISDSEESRIDVNRASSPATNEPPGRYFNMLVRQQGTRLETVQLSPESDEDEFARALTIARRADVVLVPMFVKVRTSSGRIGVPQSILPFLQMLEQSGVPTVLIAFGNPYTTTVLPRARGLVCAYGDTEPLTEASVEVLFGLQPAGGRLPVTVPGMFPFGSGLSLPIDRLTHLGPIEAGIERNRFRDLDSILIRAVRDSAFPAAQVVVARNGTILHQASYGRLTYDTSAPSTDDKTIFDLASVSKVIATTTAAMKLCDEGKLVLDEPVSSYLPQFAAGEKSFITIRHLLTHRSGFPPFRRFFLFCNSDAQALDSVFATPLVAAPGDTTIYSDIGMITMGKVIEKVAGVPLNVYLGENFFGPLGMTSTMYNPPMELYGRIAPTEIDTLWRKALVRGQVHDENAALLGGVSGHAGLFSTASDLAVLLQMLLNKGTYAGKRYLSEKTVVEFTRTRQPRGERYLGWGNYTPDNSSAGRMFSPMSYGHTGFTGTSVWVDPGRNLLVVLLTNRVHPTRANLKIARVRPAVHDAAVRAIEVVE